jgi:low temperature requirement protein LtrA
MSEATSEGGQAGLVREPAEVGPAGFLELFFDLAFVFALTRLSQELIERLDWVGADRTLVLLVALWFIWSVTARLTGWFDTSRPATQLAVLGIMLGVLVMSVAAPDAYRSRGLMFAGGYVASLLVRALFFQYVQRGAERRAGRDRTLLWTGVSAVPWLAGAVLNDVLRVVLWGLALTVDFAAIRLGYPFPGRRRLGATDLPVAGGYTSERYRQFLIIALGDEILVTAATYAEGALTPGRSAAFGISFTTAVLLWRIYIYRAGELLGVAISDAPRPARVGVLASDAHLVMIAGIFFTTVANEVVIAHPVEPAQAAWLVVILGGPSLFLAGRALFEYVVFAAVSWSRPIGVALLLIAYWPLLARPPLLAAAAAAAVLLGVAVANVLAWRAYPRQPRTPGTAT